MSSAFPQLASEEMGAQHGFVTKQNEMVPGWYAQNPHPVPDSVVVKQDGVPLLPQFTVAQIPIGRRWPVKKDGELMHQVEFEKQLSSTRLEYYALLRSKGRDAQYLGNVEREAKPTVRHFVSMKVDPEDESKLLRIHYDPHKTRGARMDHFVDHEGERIDGSRLQHLIEAYHDPKMRDRLQAEEILEVERHLGMKASEGTGGLVSKLEILNELLADGAITPEIHSQRVAALTGAKPPEPEAKEESVATETPTTQESNPPAPSKFKKRDGPKVKTACGVEIYAIHKGRHLKNCKAPECVAAREASG